MQKNRIRHLHEAFLNSQIYNWQYSQVNFEIKTSEKTELTNESFLSLPLGVANRILNKHDFIMILLHFMDLQIWCKKDKEGFKMIASNWWKYCLI